MDSSKEPWNSVKPVSMTRSQRISCILFSGFSASAIVRHQTLSPLNDSWGRSWNVSWASKGAPSLEECLYKVIGIFIRRLAPKASGPQPMPHQLIPDHGGCKPRFFNSSSVEYKFILKYEFNNTLNEMFRMNRYFGITLKSEFSLYRASTLKFKFLNRLFNSLLNCNFGQYLYNKIIPSHLMSKIREGFPDNTRALRSRYGILPIFKPLVIPLIDIAFKAVLSIPVKQRFLYPQEGCCLLC